VIRDIDALFAANDLHFSSVIFEGFLDHVELTWVGSTDEDGDWPIHDLSYRATLFDDGRVEWKFFNMDWSVYSGDLFTGIYDEVLDVECEVPGGSLALQGEQINRAFLFDDSEPVNLVVYKNDSPDPAVAGDPLTYTLSVNNFDFLYDATQVALDDILPPEVTFVSAIPDQGSCEEIGGIVTCDLGTIPSMNNVQVVINVLINPGTTGAITNKAIAVGHENDSNASNNTRVEDTTV